MPKRRQYPRLSPELRLEAALVNYQAKLAALRNIAQCRSWWPGGERCDLLIDHLETYCYGHCGTHADACQVAQGTPCCPECTHQHRHKPAGLAVGVIRW